MRRSKRAVAGAALAAVAAAAAVPALTGAQDAQTRDVTVAEKVRAAKFLDVKPTTRGDRLGAGDRVSLRVSLSDAAGAAIGTGFSDCVSLPTPRETLSCTVTYRFGDGDVILQGVVSPKPGDRAAIVGGTGAYAGARGDAEVVAPIEGSTGTVVLHVQS